MSDLTDLHDSLETWTAGTKLNGYHNIEFISACEETARKALRHLLADNGGKSPEELEDLAHRLSPGGAHDGGALLELIWQMEIPIDPLLAAAIVRANWKGGKFGVQFLPDPASVDPDDYEFQVEMLCERLSEGCQGDPLRVLSGKDRELYLSLPENLRVYRGCSGISAELSAMGLCWTRNRRYAEWFAGRGRGVPVLVSARVNKSEILLAFDSEGGEIVVRPKRSRPLKYRPCRNRPQS